MFTLNNVAGGGTCALSVTFSINNLGPDLSCALSAIFPIDNTVCGNLLCESDEDPFNCPADCSCQMNADCDDGDVCTYDRWLICACDFVPRLYGDIDGNGFITLADLFCVLDGFAGDFTSCCFEQDDIQGSCGPPPTPACCPNGVIGLADLFAVLDAFAGEDPCCGG